MLSNLSHRINPHNRRRGKILSYTVQDEFFNDIIDDVLDYGLEISFSMFGGAGAYQPFALSTEALDTPEKQHQFAQGFWRMSEVGALKCQIQLSSVAGLRVNMHSFLHEAMHFYQDMRGLYLMPIQEDEVFPTMIDAKSNIVAILFNEAWAQTEALRASWSIKEKTGDARGWQGALKSPDWKALACAYAEDVGKGMDEAEVMARSFRRWYEGQHRAFYEAHGLDIYDTNFTRFKAGAGQTDPTEIHDKLRHLELPHLIARMPEHEIPAFFHHVDWLDPTYSHINDTDVLEQLNQRYEDVDNTNIQDIKCGSPPYIWRRLVLSDKASSEIPPH